MTKRYGIGKGRQASAADDISLSIGTSAFVAVTDACGSGKSTLLHL